MELNTPESEIEVVVGGDNVFADMGSPNAEERQAKAMVAIRIEQLIQENNLTQIAAARQMNLTQPEVSQIVRGRLKGFTLERLLQGLIALDQDVDIVIRPKRQQSGSGHMQVAYAGLATQ